ncbi:MAG TPA: peptidylprolyl isomerase [Planctomycetota bacterium]|nr:peptidylprolyl isomerase [Planctomycetota bacterium]
MRNLGVASVKRIATALLAVVGLGCGGGANGDPAPGAQTPSIQADAPPCFPDDGPVAFRAGAVPVPEKTVQRLVAHLRAAAPGLSAYDAKAQVVLQTVLPAAAMYAAGARRGDGDAPALIEKLARRAADARAALDAGEDFGKLAVERSDCRRSKARGGEIGALGRLEYDLLLAEAAFSGKPGQVVGPVWTRFGCHLLKIVEAVDGASAQMDRRRVSHLLFAYDEARQHEDQAGWAQQVSDRMKEAKVVIENESYKKIIPLDYRK